MIILLQLTKASEGVLKFLTGMHHILNAAVSLVLLRFVCASEVILELLTGMDATTTLVPQRLIGATVKSAEIILEFLTGSLYSLNTAALVEFQRFFSSVVVVISGIVLKLFTGKRHISDE